MQTSCSPPWKEHDLKFEATIDQSFPLTPKADILIKASWRWAKLFWNFFRIVGLDGRKYLRMEPDFHGQIFGSNFTWLFCLFLQPPWLNHAHFGMVWKIPSQCTSQVLTVLSLTKKGHVWRSPHEVISNSGTNGLMC